MTNIAWMKILVRFSLPGSVGYLYACFRIQNSKQNILSVQVFIFLYFRPQFLHTFGGKESTYVGDLVHVLEKPVTDARRLL